MGSEPSTAAWCSAAIPVLSLASGWAPSSTRACRRSRSSALAAELRALPSRDGSHAAATSTSACFVRLRLSDVSPPPAAAAEADMAARLRARRRFQRRALVGAMPCCRMLLHRAALPATGGSVARCSTLRQVAQEQRQRWRNTPPSGGTPEPRSEPAPPSAPPRLAPRP